MATRLLRKNCAHCGAGMECGPDHESGHCWCDRFPPVLPPTPGLECLCPRCLTQALQPHVEKLIASVPKAERRRNPAFTRYFKAGVFLDGLDYYKENTGHTVFTEWYHLKRGECCGNGCRHCPY